ncbi:MAG: hypothetical protein ACREHG_06150, partial [Candidatus Saccharimonadales bacterium]
LEDGTALTDNFLRRLDLLRNGAARYEGQKDFSPVSYELDHLSTNQAEADPIEATLPAEVIEQMDNNRWDANKFQDFLSTVLDKWGLLSEELVDWEVADSRSGPSADSQWQGVITPKITALSVDGDKKLMKVPEKFDRTIAKALPVAAHELTHDLQHEYSVRLAERLPIAKVKGWRYVTGFEMGGISEERRLLARLGRDRPTNFTYLRALEAKLSGANQTQAARAFAEAKADRSDETYALAGKNVLRLYRYGGYDSQALDYAEQALIDQALKRLPDEQRRAVAIAGGSFGLADAAALRRVGLLDLPRELDRQPAEMVLSTYLENFAQGLN